MIPDISPVLFTVEPVYAFLTSETFKKYGLYLVFLISVVALVLSILALTGFSEPNYIFDSEIVAKGGLKIGVESSYNLPLEDGQPLEFLSTNGEGELYFRSIPSVTGDSKGFLPPHMTTTERDSISSVPFGLMIYNSTTNLVNFYNGSSWMVLAVVPP